jgi:hypothetical protein
LNTSIGHRFNIRKIKTIKTVIPTVLINRCEYASDIVHRATKVYENIRKTKIPILNIRFKLELINKTNEK